MTLDLDLDALIDDAVLFGELSDGARPQWLAARASGDLRTIAVLANVVDSTNATPKAPQWTAEEDAFLRDNYLTLSDAELARALGRSEVGVHLRWERKLNLPARSKRDDLLCARGVARLLGIRCAKSVARLIDHGLLRGRTLPLDATVYAVTYPDLLRFALNPVNWIYFRPERVVDPTLRRLIAIRKARWGDEWWTPGQAAAYYGCDDRTVYHHFVKRGRIPVRRWGNHWMLRSDVLRVTVHTGKGHGHENWTPAADAFLLYARGVGLSWRVVETLCGIPHPAERYALLWRNGKVLDRVAVYNLSKRGLQVDPGAQTLYVPYAMARGRFPWLDRAVDRFRAGHALTSAQAVQLQGVWWSWLAWHASTDEQRTLARKLEFRGRSTDKTLRAAYAQVTAWGFVW